MSEPPAPAPDDKDWTWVLEAPCPDCGFVATDWDVPALAQLIDSSVPRYLEVLARDDVRQRPASEVWSALEYAAHVRDVHQTMYYRMNLLLTQELPTFANWDQDATAREQRYDLQDPVVVAAELADAAHQVSRLYRGIEPTDYAHRGLRSDGSAFTVLTLARYHLHDIVHHLYDVKA